MAKLRFNKNFNINRVVKRLVYTVLALYVGGTIMDVFGDILVNTSSAFYTGLSLIGWTVGNTPTNGTSTSTTIYVPCGSISLGMQPETTHNCITSTTSSAGVLAVIGIIGIAGVVMEFVSFN